LWTRTWFAYNILEAAQHPVCLNYSYHRERERERERERRGERGTLT
jgi:hypothetical protein